MASEEFDACGSLKTVKKGGKPAMVCRLFLVYKSYLVRAHRGCRKVVPWQRYISSAEGPNAPGTG